MTSGVGVAMTVVGAAVGAAVVAGGVAGGVAGACVHPQVKIIPPMTVQRQNATSSLFVEKPCVRIRHTVSPQRLK